MHGRLYVIYLQTNTRTKMTFVKVILVHSVDRKTVLYMYLLFLCRVGRIRLFRSAFDLLV